MIRMLIVLLVLVLQNGTALAQELFPVRDAGEARDRSYDVLHYRLDISFDEPTRSVSGRVATTLVPFQPVFRTIVFDAEEMDISRAVLLPVTPLSFTRQEKTVTLVLDRAYTLDDTLTVALDYSCTPRKGLYFIQPDSAYPAKPRQIWSQGEDMDNHFWFPCYDFPNDKATSEVYATVAEDMTVLSNGALVSVRANSATRTRTFHWRENHPHSSYLIMLAIGNYAVLTDSVGSLPLQYYVYPDQTDDARICFRETPAMIRFFNEKIGFAYPWEKYAQVLINEFVVGGMENTSATSLADDAAVFDARARIDNSPTSLIAHELAHQWWGDVVTCKDWRHLWLNEGFASYFDPLYHEATRGRNEFDFTMYEAQRSGINTDKTLGRKPIVSVGSYGANLYPRGASVLHMLRFLLGDELFWRSLRHYITKYQFLPVDTDDLKVAIEEVTGQNLYWFFDQWVYKAGYPVFAVSSTWEDSTLLLYLHVSQRQTLDSLTGVFRTPVDIELTTEQGSATHRVFIDSKDTVIALSAPSRPRMVIFDKGNWLLKELDVLQSVQEWVIQATEATHPIDRLRALEYLATVDDTTTVLPVIDGRARSDPFWGVRREAVQMLGMISGSSAPTRFRARKSLLEAVHDPHPAVRSTAVAFLTDSGDVEMISTLRGLLSDSSYQIVARALRALSKADPLGSRQILVDHLDTPSHRNAIAATALSALADVDTALAREEALLRVRYGYPSPVRGVALRILRQQATRGSVSAGVFLPLLRDTNVWLRNAAINALGDCGSQESLSPLDTIAADPRNPSATAARRSAARIRSRIDSKG